MLKNHFVNRTGLIIIWVLSTFFGWFVLTPLPAGDETPLEPSDVRFLLNGNTIHGIGEESGWFFAIYYKPDGTVSGKSSPYESSKYIEYDEGIWEVTEKNGYCLQWNKFKSGIKRCMEMISINEGYEFVTKNGERQSIVTILKGNPNNL